MFKHAARSLAIALLFTASLIPVVHGLSTHSSRVPVVVAVSGGDPEPTEPGIHAVLVLLGLA